MIETTYHISCCPCNLALLTDSHNRPADPILSSLRAHCPDLILIAGDFVYGNAPLDGTLKMDESYNAMSLLRGCSSIAPTFVSLGNHEWMLSPADLSLIESTGVIILDNTFTTTIINGKKIVIAGLTSARVTEYQTFRTEYVGSSHFSAESELYPQLTCSATHPLPNTAWITEMERQPGFKILMCHHPEYYPTYLRDRNIDLILSGHAHGGQWRFYHPFKREWTGVWSPGQGLWPPYTSGVHENRLIISRGLANTTIVPRINNPTEIVYVDAVDAVEAVE